MGESNTIHAGFCSGTDGVTTDHYISVPLFHIFILGIVGFLGICFNILVLNVWSFRCSYAPSTYLFKSLAVVNILYMSFWFVYRVFWNGNTYLRLFFSILSQGNHKSGLMIMLILATVRYITVFYPCQTSELLTRCRMRLVITFSVTYCLLAHGCYCGYFLLTGHREIEHPGVVAVRKAIDYLIPSTMEILLMLTVLWKLLREHYKLSSAVSTSVSAHGTADYSFDLRAMHPTQESRRNARRVGYVVFAMCLLSLIAYQMTAVVCIVFVGHGPVKRYFYVATLVDDYICFINASIHFFFYLFIRKFRARFKKRVSLLLQQYSSSSSGFWRIVRRSGAVVKKMANERLSDGLSD